MISLSKNPGTLFLAAMLSIGLIYPFNFVSAQNTPWVALGLAAPTVATGQASLSTFASVTLSGSVVPNGSATRAWFEWGTDPLLSNSNALTNTTSFQSAGSGYSIGNYSVTVSGLANNKTYYYRVVANNAFGTGSGEIKSFNAGSTSLVAASPVYYGTPTFVSYPSQTLLAREGQLFTYRVQAVSNAGVIVYRIISGQEGMFINASNGVVAWVPNFSQSRPEPYLVIIGASNGLLEVVQNLSIKVEDVALSEPRMVNDDVSENNVRLESFNIGVETDGANVVVFWQTNKPARGRAIYDTVSEAELSKDFRYANATPEADLLTTEHRIELNGLAVESTYYFRTVSKTKDEIDVGSERSFVLLPSGEVNLGLAAALVTLGRVIFSPWILILIVGVLAVMLYRSRKKKSLLIK